MKPTKLMHFSSLLIKTSILALLLSMEGVYAAIPNIDCSSNPAIFNTAFDGVGGELITGNDSHWELTSLPGKSTPPYQPVNLLHDALNNIWAPAVVVGDPSLVWHQPFNNANWISDNNWGTQNTFFTDYFYRYSFNLAPAAVSNLVVSMDYFSDNSIHEIYVNGIRQSTAGGGSIASIPNGGALPYSYSGFLASKGGAMTLDKNWQPGLNTIVVQIASSDPKIGFVAAVKGTTTCSASTVAPIPTLSEWGFIILASLMGFCTLFAMRPGVFEMLRRRSK